MLAASNISVEELSCSEDGGSVFFQNIDTSMPDYMALYPKDHNLICHISSLHIFCPFVSWSHFQEAVQ
jgi:hypothetical protein